MHFNFHALAAIALSLPLLSHAAYVVSCGDGTPDICYGAHRCDNLRQYRPPPGHPECLCTCQEAPAHVGGNNPPNPLTKDRRQRRSLDEIMQAVIKREAEAEAEAEAEEEEGGFYGLGARELFEEEL